ncbi:MAG: DNA replication/repair protein RecF [Parvibaculales bacterium]
MVSSLAPQIDTASQSQIGAEAVHPPFAPHICELTLTDFRSYSQVRLSCAKGGVVLTGDNGIGKTNILEAVSQFGPSRGLRSASLSELARFDGAGGWAISGRLMTQDGEMRIGVGMDAGKSTRRLRLDGEPAKGFESLLRYCPQLWLTPSMDRLFVDGASGRRKFLDRFTTGLLPYHNKALLAFEKAMRERNRLLQDPNPSAVWLDGIETNMAEQGVAIAAARLEALDVLSQSLADGQHAVFPQAQIALDGRLEADLRQRPAGEVEDDYRQLLARQRGLDAAATRTLEGPHRTDLITRHMGKDMAADKCSTGEQKALLVGLILAQARVIAAQTGAVPVLLLDEVTAHLDARRRQALFEVIAELGTQAWLTGTDADIFQPFTQICGATHLQIQEGQPHVLQAGEDIS